MVTLINYVIPGPDLNCAVPWYFGDFRNIFLPNAGEDQKKVLPSERGALALCNMVNPALVILLRS